MFTYDTRCYRFALMNLRMEDMKLVLRDHLNIFCGVQQSYICIFS